MVVSARILSPLDINYNEQYGLGFCTDIKSGLTYFYVSYFARKVDVHTWKVYRFLINEQPFEWEFVGDIVGCQMENVFVSSCNRYFWSIQHERERLIFRQIEIETLNYVEYKHRGIDQAIIKQTLSIYIRTTSHGIFILFDGQETDDNDNYKNIDYVFHFHFNERDQRVNLEQINLPVLVTSGPYPEEKQTTCEYWSTGLIELHDSLYFYRIDYFGDLHVLEWKGSPNWTNLLIEGNFRPQCILESEDRNFANHLDNPDDWKNSIVNLFNIRRFYLPHGIVYETDGREGSVFYKLDFQLESHSCKCKKMFCTLLLMYKEIFLIHNIQNESTLLFINMLSFGQRHMPYWSLLDYNRVPSLKDLAYWAVRHHMIPEPITNLPTSSSSLSSIKRVFSRLLGRKAKRQKVQQEDPLWPNPKSILRLEPKARIVSVSREQVLHLLKRLRTY
ncbi:hypothetical protein M3Y95_00988500 [Aphelenchoides besseyi]|nr:hypothetical protein M3Y95_00988500 [Aphelenchoides besseyi]